MPVTADATPTNMAQRAYRAAASEWAHYGVYRATKAAQFIRPPHGGNRASALDETRGAERPPKQLVHTNEDDTRPNTTAAILFPPLLTFHQ